MLEDALTLPAVVETQSEEETRALGARLAQALQPGAVVCVCGPLGTGKTRLVQGLCEGLGVPLEEVSSPTYAIVNTYEGRLPVFHVDLYRVADIEEVEATGLLDLMPAGVSLVEWADRAPEIDEGGAIWIWGEDAGPTRRRWRIGVQAARGG